MPIAGKCASWPVAVAAWTLCMAQASAACLPNPDPQIRALQTLVAKDATQALEQVRSRLDALHPGATTQHDDAYLASLYAVQAEAYNILQLPAEGRTAAAEGLKRNPDVKDPVHVDLVSAYAETAHDAVAIAAALEAVEKARVAQSRGSTADTCLSITRGLLENREGRADLAFVTLTQAYRTSLSRGDAEPHVLSAALLSVVMRGMGDYEQALALNQEEIDWDAAHNATLSLSVSRFMRGQVLKLMGDYKAAIVEFAAARRLSVTLDDDQGVAFADQRICESHVELGELDAARQECANALRVFSASHSTASVKETRALFARMDLRQGRPQSALAALDEVLDHAGADLPPLHVAPFYESRAEAHFALNQFAAAYLDLREYERRSVAANAAERQRQIGALRARFATDREIERNVSLQHELAASRDEATRQAHQLRLNALVVLAGICVIAMLAYFLILNHRYRQQLVSLASQDALTGLPNRRSIAEVATGAMQAAKSARQPLTIAVIDLDHFKAINDCCGHATGDHVLKEFARAGREALRETDALGRWGGEEFLLVMPGATLEVAVGNLERLRTLTCGIRLPASGVGLRVTLSAGLAEYDWNNVRCLDDLIARADSALYEAKNGGRDLIRIADARFITGSHAIRRAQRQ